MKKEIVELCKQCIFFDGVSCLHEKVTDGDTAKFILFSGCGLIEVEK